jgi:hypothetical protein
MAEYGTIYQETHSDAQVTSSYIVLNKLSYVHNLFKNQVILVRHCHQLKKFICTVGLHSLQVKHKQ